MDAQKTAFLLAALTVAAAISGRPADAAGARPDSKSAVIPAKMSAPVPAVIVKLGDAMLEEYSAGDPDRRTVILREGDSAKQPSGPSARNERPS